MHDARFQKWVPGMMVAGDGRRNTIDPRDAGGRAGQRHLGTEGMVLCSMRRG